MISIIVPVYNAQEYLKECVESILNQSFKDIELILVNDGSTDNSLQICRSFNDKRIVVIDKENGGVSSARNKGIDIAKGDYLGFVDSDDTLPWDALEILHQCIENHKTDAVIGNFYLQYGERFVKHSQRLKEGKYKYRDILDDFIDDGTLSGFLIGSLCAALYRKDIIENHNIRLVEGLKNNEDGLFNFEFALNAESVASVSNIVYYYRQDEGSTISLRKSENFGDKIFKHLESFEWDGDLYRYDIQKHRRLVTLGWWNILHNYKDFPFYKSISFISHSLSKNEIREGLKYMKPLKMNHYKRFFFYLMKWRLSFIMYISLKYIVPILKRRLQR